MASSVLSLALEINHLLNLPDFSNESLWMSSRDGAVEVGQVDSS